MAAIVCAVGFATPALAGGCVAASSPSGGAGVSALYGELAKSMAAEPLSVDIATRASGGLCAWVYSVKVLTAAGSVAVLDFDFEDLGLIRVEGPLDDPEIARLAERVAEEAGKHVPGGASAEKSAESSNATKSGSDSDSGGGDSEGGGDDSGGGSGDSGGDDSGSGGDDSGGDGGDSDGGDSGGDGGDSDGGDSGSDD